MKTLIHSDDFAHILDPAGPQWGALIHKDGSVSVMVDWPTIFKDSYCVPPDRVEHAAWALKQRMAHATR